MLSPAMKPREEGGVVDARLNVYGKWCPEDEPRRKG